MTGPYQRAIEYLARIYQPEIFPQYSGAFEAVVAIFPAYLPTEIALDVVKQRRRDYERSHPMLNAPVFVSSAAELDALMGHPHSPLIIDHALFADLADKEKQA